MDNKFVLSPSFNDIVFENRNKKYGAYEIRQKYTRYAILAGICAILFFTCGSLTWAYVEGAEERHDWRVIDISLTPEEGLPTPNEPPKKPEPPKPVEPPKTSAAPIGPRTPQLTTIIEITDTDSIPPGNLDAGRDPKGDSSGLGSGQVVDIPKGNCIDCIQDSTPPPLRIIDHSNHPPVCSGLDEYLKKNIRYPQICRENGIEGTVFVQFIVDTEGNYREVQVLRGPHPALNAEALRVMSAMPAWTPAKDDNGELVEFIMRKPIKFQLAH